MPIIPRRYRCPCHVAPYVSPADFIALKQDEYKAKPGEGTYQFSNRLAARRARRSGHIGSCHAMTRGQDRGLVSYAH